MTAPLSVRELVNMLRDNEQLGYSVMLGRRQRGIVEWDDRQVGIEGNYNLALVVKKLNERMTDGSGT